MKKRNLLNTEQKLPSPTIVDTPAGIDYLREALQDIGYLSIDTESNSLFAYQERVCLIQLSTPNADFLVDPIRLAQPGMLDFLGDIFADPSIEKILHAAEYDVRCLRRDFGFRFTNIFDTMIAARLVGWEQVGLGNILEAQFGVHVNKKHQRANWGKRPLSPDLIRYAQVDTHYLLALRKNLHQELKSGGNLKEAAELFNEVCQVEWNGSGFDQNGFWNLKGARDLSSQEMAILKELYLYREQTAQKRDLPVFKIMGDSTLLELAKAKPASLRALYEVKGLGSTRVKRYGRDLLQAIRRGQNATPPKRPRKPRKSTQNAVSQRFDKLRTWRKEQAAERGIPSEFVISKTTLWKLANAVPHTLEQLAAIDGIGPWRLEAYGSEILQVLSQD